MSRPMGRQIVLYCQETPGLRLGPGVSLGTLPVRGEEDLQAAGQIEFLAGFATFDEDTYPLWETWVRHPGTPHIEVLEADAGQVPEGTPSAFPCPVGCGKTFATRKQLNGHLMSHKRA